MKHINKKIATIAIAVVVAVPSIMLGWLWRDMMKSVKEIDITKGWC